MLDERARLLLKALVERYIADGQPVGSRTLSRASGLELSPATVRNVMSDLEELGLIVSIHAGLDIGLPDPIHCPPERTAKMLEQIESDKARIILAHMGGFDQWDAVEKYLVGRKVWFDTAYTLGSISQEQFRRIVRNHGADRILFGTDSPWSGQKESIELLSEMKLTENEMESIFWRNSAGLLGLL